MPNRLLERFLNYVKKETRSDFDSPSVPSTESQTVFLKQLEKELIELGFQEVYLDPANSMLSATVPATTSKNAPTVGFIAHVDTADFESRNIRPQLHENYDGKDIVLNSEEHIILSPKDFPNLKNYIGHTLITTNGKTLLGADDKSGVANIVTAGAYLLKHPEIEHCKMRVSFGPDEEIGKGADLFDVKKFGCDFAYTVDGSSLGELQYECFNASMAEIVIKGKNAHPGSAKNIMINSLELAREFQNAVPRYLAPEYTEHKEGFFFLDEVQGCVEETKMTYVIRDFDADLFEAKNNYLKKIAEEMNRRFDEPRVFVTITEQYRNMAEIIEENPQSVELAIEAMEALGIKPDTSPIRGGTDGSKISFMGLPTPNLFTGGENFHGRYEFASLDVMQKSVDVILKITQLACK